MGVFVRPEDAGIHVEYVNPSFLVKKSSGGYRLVTAFADVGRYSKSSLAVSCVMWASTLAVTSSLAFMVVNLLTFIAADIISLG